MDLDQTDQSSMFATSIRLVPAFVAEEAPEANYRAATSTCRRLPLVVFVLALSTFLVLATEFVVAGILPEVAEEPRFSFAQAAQP